MLTPSCAGQPRVPAVLERWEAVGQSSADEGGWVLPNILCHSNEKFKSREMS